MQKRFYPLVGGIPPPQAIPLPLTEGYAPRSGAVRHNVKHFLCTLRNAMRIAKKENERGYYFWLFI